MTEPTTKARRVRPWIALVAAIALLASGCSSDGTADDPAASAAPSDTTVPADACAPATAGAEGAAIVELIEAQAHEHDLRSVVYRVTRGDEVLAAGAVGDSMVGVPATQNQSFRAGNVAFAYLGTLLLLMDEAGEVQLDTPVGELLPELDLPAGDEVTLAMLANSTSGYPDYVPVQAFGDRFDSDPFQAFTPDDLLGYAFATPPWYPPGTAWSYAHTNYVLLGEALAAAAGQPLDELLDERVIAPLGLPRTEPVLTPALPEPSLHTYTTERGPFEESTFWNPSWQTAPGSVVATTVCDMAASARGIGTGALLSDDAFAAFTSDATASLEPPEDCPSDVCRQLSPTLFYGLGVIVMSGWIVQTPLFGGAGSVHAYLPDADVAVAIIAVDGPDSQGGTNLAQPMWAAIAEQLTPDNVPTR